MEEVLERATPRRSASRHGRAEPRAAHGSARSGAGRDRPRRFDGGHAQGPRRGRAGPPGGGRSPSRQSSSRGGARTRVPRSLSERAPRGRVRRWLDPWASSALRRGALSPLPRSRLASASRAEPNRRRARSCSCRHVPARGVSEQELRSALALEARVGRPQRSLSRVTASGAPTSCSKWTARAHRRRAHAARPVPGRGAISHALARRLAARNTFAPARAVARRARRATRTRADRRRACSRGEPTCRKRRHHPKRPRSRPSRFQNRAPKACRAERDELTAARPRRRLRLPSTRTARATRHSNSARARAGATLVLVG